MTSAPEKAQMAIAFFAMLASLGWSGVFAWSRWLRHRPNDERMTAHQAELAAEDHDRLQRLESAVDALSIEIERIGEAQRFTARLLDERLPAALPGSRAGRQLEPGRVITPH